jgi:Glycosyl hydrolases family 18
MKHFRFSYALTLLSLCTGLHLPLYVPAQTPTSIHEIELERHIQLENLGVKTEAHWSLVSGLWETSSNATSFKGLPWVPVFKDRISDPKGNWAIGEFYGYHPFWMGNGWETYNLNAINRILYFAYAVDPKTGESRNSMDTWSSTQLHIQAQKVATKVDLVVALYGEENLSRFFSNDAAQIRLMKNVIKMLKGRGNGVNLDFQGLTAKTKPMYLRFAKKFALELRAVDPNYYFTITLPPSDPDKIFDFSASKPFANRFLIMGYVPQGAYKNRTGAVSLTDTEVKSLVENYAQQGIPAAKMVLILPLFGKEWIADSPLLRTLATTPARILPLRYFQEMYGLISKYDADGQSAYAIRSDSEKYLHAWWDTEQSFTRKVDDLRELKIKGLGVWCLGYDKSLGADETLIPLLPSEEVVETKLVDKPLEKNNADSIMKAELKAQYINPGMPLSYIDSISPKKGAPFCWVEVDSFPPLVPSTDEEFLFLSLDVPLPPSPQPWKLVGWGLLFLGCFLWMSLLWPLTQFKLRKLIFVDHVFLAFLYLPLMGLLLLALVLGFGARPSEAYVYGLLAVGTLLLTLILAMAIVKISKDVKEPEPRMLEKTR